MHWGKHHKMLVLFILLRLHFLLSILLLIRSLLLYGNIPYTIAQRYSTASANYVIKEIHSIVAQ